MTVANMNRMKLFLILFPRVLYWLLVFWFVEVGYLLCSSDAHGNGVGGHVGPLFNGDPMEHVRFFIDSMYRVGFITMFCFYAYVASFERPLGLIGYSI